MTNTYGLKKKKKAIVNLIKQTERRLDDIQHEVDIGKFKFSEVKEEFRGLERLQ
jgi:hypothetical protein